MSQRITLFCLAHLRSIFLGALEIKLHKKRRSIFHWEIAFSFVNLSSNILYFISALLMYFAFMSAFSWMTIISGDICATFGYEKFSPVLFSKILQYCSVPLFLERLRLGPGRSQLWKTHAGPGLRFLGSGWLITYLHICFLIWEYFVST